jgi:hypothetical protein
MSSDAHTVDPIADLNQKISARDPSIVITDNPKAPPLPTLTPVGGFMNPPSITATVESILERVKINGVSPTFKGSSIDFNLPNPPTISATPIISSVTTFQSQPPIPAPAPAPVLFPTPLNEPQPSIQVQTTPDTNSGNVPPVTLPIYGNAVIGDVTPDSEIFGGRYNTTPPLDLVRQNGGILKLDELSNRDFVDSAANIFTPKEGYGALDPEQKSIIPVLLKRGDNAKTGLFYIQANTAYVVEGADGDDHTTTYPDPANYYTGAGGEGDSIHHPWKVTNGGLVAPEGGEEGAEPVQQWNYVGGEIYTQGTKQTVVDGIVSDGDAIGAGFIVLAFDRDPSTREIVADSAAVTLEETVPDSDYTTQYRVLAKVNSDYDNPVTQYQFEEIRIFEDLAVVNGEFQLIGLEMSHRNYYDLPL